MTLKNFYFMVMTIVGLIGLIVGYGTVIYSKLQMTLITDEEYLQGSYRVDSYRCENKTMRNPETETEQPRAITPEEIEDCLQESHNKALVQRSYDAKQTSIGGITRGTLFLLVFLMHGVIFLRTKENKQHQKK